MASVRWRARDWAKRVPDPRRHAAWGDRWLVGPEGTPLVLHHTACDHDMHAVIVCSECDAPLDVRNIRATRGPGAPTGPVSV